MANPLCPVEPLNVQTLWEKYEDIAMHFNDLLMRLRLQSLAGIAAISTLVGIFAKQGASNLHMDWLVATAMFIAMALVWIAIWCLDFFYYNRLLMGSVAAIVALEEQAKTGAIEGINMSISIDGEFQHFVFKRDIWRFKGVMSFYGIVFAVIIAGAVFSLRMYCVSL